MVGQWGSARPTYLLGRQLQALGGLMGIVGLGVSGLVYDGNSEQGSGQVTPAAPRTWRQWLRGPGAA